VYHEPRRLWLLLLLVLLQLLLHLRQSEPVLQGRETPATAAQVQTTLV
jgi:hypothetical protein